MTVKSKKEPTHKQLLRRFVNTIKRNTIALKNLKTSLDQNNRPQHIDKIIDISTKVDEKLDVVYKLRNDIKIYKTINTILTNHYVKQTRDHENNTDEKIFKLEQQIKQSYDDLKKELSKMAAFGVASRNNSVLNNIGSPIQNSNVFLLGNQVGDLKLRDLYIRNQIYNGIIKKIDTLFCGMVSLNLTLTSSCKLNSFFNERLH